MKIEGINLRDLPVGTNILDLDIPPALELSIDTGVPWLNESIGGGATPSSAWLVTGWPGAGKTTGMATLAAQMAVRLGARLWIVDRHARLPQSLAARLGALRPALAYEPAADPRQIETVLDMWEAEIEDRLAGRRGQPWVLLIDEANSFSAAAATRPIAVRIGRLSERVANEGRKLQMGVIAGAQIANTRSLAGSFAYTVSTFVAYRANPVTIYPYVPAEYANLARDLEPGEAVALHVGGVDVVRTPRAEPEDIREIAALLPPPVGGGATPHAFRLDGACGASDNRAWAPEPVGGVGWTTSCDPPPPATAVPPPPPDNQLSNQLDNAERIRQLYAQGLNKTAICREVFGYKDGATWAAVEAALNEEDNDDE